MKLIRRTSRKRTTFLALLLASTSIFTGQKVYEYSAEPSAEKDCSPFFTDSTAAATMPGTTPESPPVDNQRVKAIRESLPWVQKGGDINDASCLSRTSVYGVVQVRTVDDIKAALAFAKSKNLKVSLAGARHSMGGHAFFKNALVLDITQFNKMSLDENSKVLTVQSGATWHDIQSLLHPKYAVKAMQSTDIFTVGGSISVNAHGMDHQVGAIGKTIRSMNLLLPDGTVKKLSRTENQELFNLVIGGYGLFGIILDVELDVTDNVVYRSGRRIIDYQAFPDVFNKELAADKGLGLMYAHLSTAPQSFLRETILYTYNDSGITDAQIPPLEEVSSTKLRRFVINFSKRGSIPMRIKWFAEKYIEPRMESCSITRNQAMKDGEACLISRNEPMHDSVKYLKNNLKNDTDILQEYFVPRAQLVPFIDGLRQIMTENEVNVLNASIRVVHQEDNFLNYAPADMFSVVLYINQETTDAGNQKMSMVTQKFIDLTLSHQGRFFLPYQLHYTPEQLQQSYPEIAAFFKAKKQYDPDLVLTNTFYEKYANSLPQAN